MVNKFFVTLFYSWIFAGYDRMLLCLHWLKLVRRPTAGTKRFYYKWFHQTRKIAVKRLSQVHKNKSIVRFLTCYHWYHEFEYCRHFLFVECTEKKRNPLF